MTSTQTTPIQLLMCSPEHFGVHYSINPWMCAHLNNTNSNTALKQWNNLRTTLEKYATVTTLTPQPELPDLVFVANAGLADGEKILLSHFRTPERQREEPHLARWFEQAGYQTHTLARGLFFEGGGDALFENDTRLWLGHGFRSDVRVKATLEQHFSLPVVPLELVDPHFYHLDTCFCPLRDHEVLYYPGAFSKSAQETINRLIPRDKQITVTREDADRFACNAIFLETTDKPIIVVNALSDPLRLELETRGYTVICCPVDEFLKAGGATRCLSLALNP